MLGQPSPAFAVICLPWAAGDTVPTACPQKTSFLLSRISALLLHQLHRAGRRGEGKGGEEG